MAEEPSLKKQGWELLNVARSELPPGEASRYAWVATTGVRPDIFIWFGLIFVLVGITAGALIWSSQRLIAALIGVAIGLVLIFGLRALLENILSIHRRIIVVSESKKVFVVRMPLRTTDGAAFIGEIEEIPGAIGPFDGVYLADEVLGRRIWIARSEFDEVEAAKRYLIG